MKQRLIRMLLFAPLLLAGGCATEAMKGTPFFAGEFRQRQGPVEDRVNLWPLLYYRDPALSLLWPVGEYVRKEQLAVRPLFSVYHLDQPEGREWNVLWPIFQQDERSGDGRVFPLVWWGDHYFDVFPLYWHSFSGNRLRDVLLPLWWYERAAEQRHLSVLLNLAGYDRDGGARSWWAFPLAADLNDRDGRRYRYQLWPLSHQIDDPAKGLHAQGVFPLWWYRESPQDWLFATLPWWQGGNADGDAWRMLFPLFWSGRDGNRKSFYSLLGGGSSDPTETTWVAPPLLSWGRSDTNSGETTVLAGLGRWSHDQGESHSHVVPLYLHDRDPEGERFLSLPWSHVEERDGSGWSLAPGYFTRYHRDGHLTLSPVYASGSDRTAQSSWHAVLPLYYSGDDAHGHTFATLLGGRETRDDGAAWTIYPLLSRVDARGGTNDWWLVAPLSHFQWDAHESRSHVFPLYYRDTASDTLISPFYAEWPDAGARRTAIPPLLSWRTERGGTDDWWLLAGLGHLSLGQQPGPSHLLPVYYRNPAKGLSLSPLYCRFEHADGATHFFPPLLAGYGSDARADNWWLLGGLYGHEARRDGKSADRLLPLYAWSEDEYFYTALAGWNEDGFRYYLTPLVSSSHDANESSFRIFPLYSRTRYLRDHSTRTRVLWAVHRSQTNFTRSIFFPLYGYTYHGSLDAPADPRHSSVAGTEFFCFPFCWYDNVRRTSVSGPASNRTARVARERGHGAFPLWSVQHTEDPQRGRIDEHSLLWFLYDRRAETGAEKPHAYVRHRVLWRLYHYEKLDGDVSVDVLPGITYDARKDGFRKTSFLWRVFRWEKAPDGKRKLDLLFLPLLRE